MEAETDLPVLALEDVRKRKGTPLSGQFELRLPELTLYPGELIAFVGDSGCGKTTLLDILSLISTPDSAARFNIRMPDRAGMLDVRPDSIEADEIHRADCRSGIGYVLQTGGLLPFLNVAQNAALPFQVGGQNPDRSRIDALADKLGISAQMGLLPFNLSGGQRQRAAILRALVHRPALILADEPTAAVDWKRAQQIVQDLCDLARNEQVAVAIVTHDLRLVEDRMDRIYEFDLSHEGGSLASGTAQELTISVCRPRHEAGEDGA